MCAQETAGETETESVFVKGRVEEGERGRERLRETQREGRNSDRAEVGAKPVPMSLCS